MGTKFEFSNIKPFQRSLDKFGKSLEHSPTLLEKIGSTVVAFIRTRTLRGVDAKGKTFKRYNPDYARQRRRKGRTTTPNLSFTGRMLNALISKITGKNKVRIQFSRSEEGEKAFYQEQKGREIMGLTNEEENKITKVVQSWLDKEVGKF